MRKTKNHHICLKCGYDRNYLGTKIVHTELCKDCIRFINDNKRKYPGNVSKSQLGLYEDNRVNEVSRLGKLKSSKYRTLKEIGNKEWHRKTTFKARKVHKGNKVIITSEQVIVQGSLVYCKCSNCGKILHLECFGMREMDDGIIRNQPQCWECR